jgi:hypothetical protein
METPIGIALTDFNMLTDSHTAVPAVMTSSMISTHWFFMEAPTKKPLSP